MSNGIPRRRRSPRVTSLELPPSRWERFRLALRNPDVLMRVGLCLVTCIALWALVQPWSPPFTFRDGMVTPRAITARVEFDRKDEAAKEKLKNQARSRVSAIFDQDVTPWQTLEDYFHNSLLAVGAGDQGALVSLPA